tara:strand:- start:270 stop:989 length:720 start_codon:yes stop_codon:yes gene_type:complete
MRSKPVTKWGIPINLVVALVIGFFTANYSVETGMSISDALVYSLAIGIIVQEIVLVQVLSFEPNTEYQSRLFKGNVTTSKRLQMLFIPFMLILVIGFISLYLSERSFDLESVLRVVAVSVIFTLGVDPLFGLTDRDYLAVFGAAVVYLLIIGSAIRGYENLVGLFDIVFGDFLSFSFTNVTFCYLILSIRWTYYRLFCFNQIEEPTHIVLESLVPVLIILLPSLPDLFDVVRLIYSGSS